MLLPSFPSGAALLPALLTTSPSGLLDWLLAAGAAYCALGLLFAVPFVLFGAGRIDPLAAHGTPGFRLAILPGAAALWPLLLRRWIAGTRRPPDERGAHRARDAA